MTTRSGGLGRLFDIGTGVAVVDLNGAGNTGKRISMENAGGITFVIFCATGTAGSDLAVDLRQHTAYTGGTSADLDIITSYYSKQELALDNDEAWTEATQTAASEITDCGGLGTSGELQNLVIIEVTRDQLADGYTHLSLDVPQPGAAKYGGVLYILWDLNVQRKPSNMPNLLNPGAANV